MRGEVGSAPALPPGLCRAQHNVKLQLTYLDVEKGEASRGNAKTAALLEKALQPVPKRSGGGGLAAAA